MLSSIKRQLVRWAWSGAFVAGGLAVLVAALAWIGHEDPCPNWPFRTFSCHATMSPGVRVERSPDSPTEGLRDSESVTAKAAQRWDGQAWRILETALVRVSGSLQSESPSHLDGTVAWAVVVDWPEGLVSGGATGQPDTPESQRANYDERVKMLGRGGALVVIEYFDPTTLEWLGSSGATIPLKSSQE